MDRKYSENDYNSSVDCSARLFSRTCILLLEFQISNGAACEVHEDSKHSCRHCERTISADCTGAGHGTVDLR